MNQSEQIDQIATALAKAQSEFTPAIKDADNPFYKSKYANLCSINKACQGPLTKNGLSVIQSTVREETGHWVLITKLLHSSGQWLSSMTPIITAKADIQSFGSAISYARRYGLAALVGVVTDEDDDGEAASPADRKQPIQKKPDVKRIYITETQGHELGRLLSKCDEEFQETVWKFLNDQCIKDFAEMPEALYEKVKARIENKLKEIKDVK